MSAPKPRAADSFRTVCPDNPLRDRLERRPQRSRRCAALLAVAAAAIVAASPALARGAGDERHAAGSHRPEQPPREPPRSRCDCANHGPCLCGPDCRCSRCPCRSPERPAARRAPRARRILFFTASWCGACRSVKGDLARPDNTPSATCARLVKAGWKIGAEDSNHVQLVDYDKSPELARQYRVESLPTFILVEHGKELRRLSGAAVSPWDIDALYRGPTKPPGDGPQIDTAQARSKAG